MEMEEKKLWQRLAKAKRPSLRLAIRNQLTERYLWLAYEMAARMAQRLPPTVSLDDLRAEAAIGLMEGILRFNLDRSKPTTYLPVRIHGRMCDWLRSLDSASRLTRQRVGQLAAAEEQLGRSLSDHECESQLGFARPAPVPNTISIFTPRGVSSTGHVKLLIHELQPVQTSTGDLRDCSYLLKGLSPRDRLIVLLYHVEGMKMKQIGREVGMCESRVSQLMPQLMARVRDNAIRGQRDSRSTIPRQETSSMIDDLGLSGHDSELFSFLDPSTIDGLRNHTAANIPLWTFGNVDNGKLTGVTCWNTRPSCIAFTKRPQVVTQLDGKWIRWGTFTTNDQLIEVSALTLIRHLFVQGYTCGLNGQRWISTPADPRLERLQYIRRRSDAVVDQRHWQLLKDNYALWARCKLDLALIIHLPRHQEAAT